MEETEFSEQELADQKQKLVVAEELWGINGQRCYFCEKRYAASHMWRIHGLVKHTLEYVNFETNYMKTRTQKQLTSELATTTEPTTDDQMDGIEPADHRLLQVPQTPQFEDFDRNDDIVIPIEICTNSRIKLEEPACANQLNALKTKCREIIDERPVVKPAKTRRSLNKGLIMQPVIDRANHQEKPLTTTAKKLSTRYVKPVRKPVKKWHKQNPLMLHILSAGGTHEQKMAMKQFRESVYNPVPQALLQFDPSLSSEFESKSVYCAAEDTPSLSCSINEASLSGPSGQQIYNRRPTLPSQSSVSSPALLTSESAQFAVDYNATVKSVLMTSLNLKTDSDLRSLQKCPHSTMQCRDFPRCMYARCPFLHPFCVFGVQCPNMYRDCSFDHGNACPQLDQCIICSPVADWCRDPLPVRRCPHASRDTCNKHPVCTRFCPFRHPYCLCTDPHCINEHANQVKFCDTCFTEFA